MSFRIAATALHAPRCRGRRGPYSPQGTAAFRHAPCLRQRAVPLATDVPSAFGGPCYSTPEPSSGPKEEGAAIAGNGIRQPQSQQGQHADVPARSQRPDLAMYSIFERRYETMASLGVCCPRVQLPSTPEVVDSWESRV